MRYSYTPRSTLLFPQLHFASITIAFHRPVDALHRRQRRANRSQALLSKMLLPQLHPPPKPLPFAGPWTHFVGDKKKANRFQALLSKMPTFSTCRIPSKKAVMQATAKSTDSRRWSVEAWNPHQQRAYVKSPASARRDPDSSESDPASVESAHASSFCPACGNCSSSC